MANYTFKTPVAKEGPIGKHRLFRFYKLDKGISIVKSGSVYSQIRYPTDDSLSSYSEVYLGGRNHTVDETTKAALIAANVGVTEANFTAL